MKKSIIICTDGGNDTAILSRRRFVRHATAAGVAVAAASVSGMRSALAQATGDKVDEADPVAQNFGYVHNTENADKEKFSRHDSSQMCQQCALYQAREEGWGACGIFPGKLVAARGWCNAWVQKAGA